MRHPPETESLNGKRISFSRPLSISLRRAIKAGLARERENLEDFESGRRRMGERSEDGPWRDVTTQWLHNQKRVIETFQSVLAAFEREEAR